MTFREIISAVKTDELIDYKKSSHEDAVVYIAMYLLNKCFNTGVISKGQAKDLKENIYYLHRSLETKYMLSEANNYQHQDFITRAREYRGQLNKGFGNKSDSELLELAVKCISAMCCDPVMMELYKKIKEKNNEKLC